MREMWRRLLVLIGRQQLDQDLEAELAAHLALKQQRLEAEGVPAKQAVRQARQELGNPLVWRENIRDVWTFVTLENLWRDVCYGLRLFAKERGFTAIVVGTLALGIGANTAIFSTINGLMLRMPPVHDPERLVRLVATNLPPNERTWEGGREVKAKDRSRLTYPLYEQIRNRGKVFDGVFGIAGNGTDVVQYGAASYDVASSKVTGTYFPTLGVQARVGRLLSEEDDVPGGPPDGWKVVISDALWARAFQRSPRAVGARITVERIPFSVVGVAPASFVGVHPGTRTDLWVPISAMEAMYPKFEWRHARGTWMMQVMGRLRAGVTLENAREQLGAMSQGMLREVAEDGLSAQDQQHFLAMKLSLREAGSGDSWVAAQFGKVLWILMAAVGAVLLIAATNVTNLLLARATARRQEIAMRLALGAPPSWVRRQLLTESALLASGGALGGLLIAYWLTRAVQQGIATRQGVIQVDASLDWTVLGFLALVLTLVVLIAGWAPAWAAAGGGLRPNAMGRHGSTLRFRGTLIVLQTALSFLLLGAAGLMLTTMRTLLGESTGFATQETVLLLPDLYNAGVDRPNQARAYRNILEQVRRLPAVTAAGWTRIAPLTGGLSAVSIEVPGQTPTPPMERMVFQHVVSDGYLEAMGIPLLAGRDVPPEMSARRDVCAVSENLARRFFGNANAAIGQRIKTDDGKLIEIVGVSANSKYQNIREPSPPTVYLPYWADERVPGMTIAVRYEGSREPVVASMISIFQREAGRLPFVRISTIDGNVRDSVRPETMLTALLSGFAVFALMISVSGIAGLLAYRVQQQRKEIGIRLALGAAPSRIRADVQRRGLVLVGLGILGGGALAYGLRRAIEAYLFRTAALDPAVWATVVLILLVAGLGGAALPAWRAARLDPMTALRTD